MVARAFTVAFHGIEAKRVEVQCALAAGLPAFNLVGLPDKAVSEARERVRAALGAIGLALPARRITINLSPADLPKEGSHYDLPIALALLAAMEVVPAERLSETIALGELSLDGALAYVPGVLPATMRAATEGKGIICPHECGAEAAWVGAANILAPGNLVALINHFSGREALPPPEAGVPEEAGAAPDLRDVKGQESAKRALEVAAAGNHHMLMIGEPGSGKSMLAARLPGILPPLSPEEALEISLVRSLAGLLHEGRISRTRPFRAPHHSASMAAMVGGGRSARPGEVSLAHRGVLFLDELPEFPRAVLESLRQPVESGETIVARANAHLRYPARILLICAMNPCKCGYLSDPARACSRAPKCGLDYQARISGPLLDRIDIQIEVPPVAPADLDLPLAREGSKEVGGRVARARAIQEERYGGDPSVRCNAEIDGDLLERYARPDRKAMELLHRAMGKMRLTARGYHRVLRVARTIADLEGAERISGTHLAESIAYRASPLAR